MAFKRVFGFNCRLRLRLSGIEKGMSSTSKESMASRAGGESFLLFPVYTPRQQAKHDFQWRTNGEDELDIQAFGVFGLHFRTARVPGYAEAQTTSTCGRCHLCSLDRPRVRAVQHDEVRRCVSRCRVRENLMNAPNVEQPRGCHRERRLKKVRSVSVFLKSTARNTVAPPLMLNRHRAIQKKMNPSRMQHSLGYQASTTGTARR